MRQKRREGPDDCLVVKQRALEVCLSQQEEVDWLPKPAPTVNAAPFLFARQSEHTVAQIWTTGFPERMRVSRA